MSKDRIKEELNAIKNVAEQYQNASDERLKMFLELSLLKDKEIVFREAMLKALEKAVKLGIVRKNHAAMFKVRHGKYMMNTLDDTAKAFDVGRERVRQVEAIVWQALLNAPDAPQTDEPTKA